MEKRKQSGNWNRIASYFHCHWKKIIESLQNNKRKKNIKYVWVVPLIWAIVTSTGQLHDDVILPLWPESLSFFLSCLILVITARCKLQKRSFVQESKTRRILVVVVKWRHHANGIYSKRSFWIYETSTGRYDGACALSMKCSTVYDNYVYLE